MSFIEERLLDEIEYGFQIGPLFDTRLLTHKNGMERRNGNWSNFRWRGSVPYNLVNKEDREVLLGAMLRARGKLYGFRFKNWLDYAVEGQALGAAPSGTTPIQLVRTYEQFGGAAFQRTILKPVAGTVTIYLDTGSGPVAKTGTIDTTTGLWTPSTAWSAGQVTGDFEYDIPVRFDTDWLPFTHVDWSTVKGEFNILELLGE